MARAFFCFIGFCLILGACTQRSICPAFQSAYIYDRDALRKKFSYLKEDTTPKVFSANKNRYLVAEPTTYRKKIRSLRTVAMRPVMVTVPDSISNSDSVSVADLDRAARSIIDSTFIPTETQAQQPVASAEDSIYVISKDKELRLLKYNGADSLVYDEEAGKYVAQRPEYYVKDVGLNIEQDSYMWYLRDHLVLPDVRLARLQQSSNRSSEPEGSNAKKSKKTKRDKKDKKGKKGFFKNLFKKKPKEEKDSTDVPPAPTEEFDFIESDSITQVVPDQFPEERNGESLEQRNPASESRNASMTAIVQRQKRRATSPDRDNGF